MIPKNTNSVTESDSKTVSANKIWSKNLTTDRRQAQAGI